ncbi:hypothetical protein ACETWI_08290 [Aeromonas hydrophila]|uniref:hypothetical protein n=1 Tax=Aeromonas hydrophila TaxID=644 RepID=UPI0009BB58BF|nr:hypothetical protein [Aeromonas hydrophila]HAT2249151.1 hypothetical protein [Aeromonas hydrophila]HAT2384319.1 hypothetical protein [Aeromonas hydrophila]HAT2416711.1 hypothetical protein [Aeromonas hydrophila]HAT2527754.1 hypothetical protein [Aeromonas hydrophila]HAT2547441.1 hypothetical protein [Aeromonas hydrophila]
MNIDKNNVAPYLSILLAIKSKNSDENFDYHGAILKILNDESDGEMTTGNTIIDSINELGLVKITPYSVRKEPSWSKNIDIKDIENHVFVSFLVKEHFAFYFSEKGKKDLIRDYFGRKKLEHIYPVPIRKLYGNFINEDEIKMLWLLGIHGQGNFKADSKVLGGKSVADTLDPLIDQSYMMSAVRTEVHGHNRKSSLGINPFRSSIWRGPCNDWNSFENKTIEILDILTSNASESETPIGILSYPISNPDDLNSPYDFSLVDYEFISEEDGQVRKELLRKLQYDYSAELTPSFTGKDISLKITYQGTHIGDVCVAVKVDDYKVTLELKTQIPIKKKFFDYYTRVFRYPELIKCWFESGHAIVNGMVFRTGYQDVEYNKFIWADYENYDVTKEKPGSDPKKPDLQETGKNKSLFCWVKNRWNGYWIEPSEFNTSESSKGWLYCDDGAGEKADFIHYVEYSNYHIISLIHIKAAKSASPLRRISVGAHDIVLNQAVKNLRYCTRKTLVEDLRQRYSNSTEKLCWHDGIKAQPEDFFSKIESLKDNKHIKKRVIVIQPHTQKSIYTSVDNSKIKTQLDVLLVSAENAIRSSGAEFYIIGLDDHKK